MRSLSDPLNRWARLGALVEWFWPRAHYALPAAAMILALCHTHIILGPVLNRSGDDMYHVLNEHAIAHGIQSGDNPLGPVNMEFGQPVLRFYQALFYLHNVAWHLLTGLNLIFLHNLTIVVCFALSPFAYMYFLRKLGLGRWAAAMGSYVSMISIAAFGNSFEAYHQAGIVTQSMGGLFFPWFMGHFIGLVRGQNRASTTAALFALAFLSHAIMSVFTVFGGALYVAVTADPIRPVWRRLLAFAALSACLVAFWALPFIGHTMQMRAVPDSIVRGGGVQWFTSVSKSELGMVLSTGRLLDDARAPDDSQTTGRVRSAEDRFIDEINIIHTLHSRPPAVTILAALGAIFGLLGIRRAAERFLFTGFLFSLMLFAGPDDFRWLRHLPFMNEIQTFRCTYLIEFFAFGLIGRALEAILGGWHRFAMRRSVPARAPLLTLWIMVVGTGAALVGAEILALGATHLKIRPTANLDEMVDAMRTLPARGFPYRVTPAYKGKYKVRHGWFAVHGYSPYCTHWKGTGPTAAYFLCSTLGSPVSQGDLNALAGIRYTSAESGEADDLIKARDEDGAPLLERLPNGRDRRGKANAWHYLMDTGRDHFLRPLVGEPLPVVCSDAQWIWLTRSWTTKYRSRLFEETTPLPLRVPAGGLAESGLLGRAKALLYLDTSRLPADREALARFAGQGRVVLAGAPLQAVSAQRLDIERSVWDALPKAFAHGKGAVSERLRREERDSGFAAVGVTALPHRRQSVQEFAYDVDVLRPTVAILPMEAAPGWGARLDGSPYPAFPAGPDMVGVLLPAGAHRLVFQWSMPRRDALALAASLAAVLAAALVWITAAVRWFARSCP